ncbi:MAG: DUF3592 domain-containing protein [Kofleriaceae bacterium]|nr:DUF3592 domain-containing protein [Kofleriaceae bacterium]
MLRHYLMSGLVIATGVLALWFGIKLRRAATMGKDWPTVSATVLEKGTVPSGRFNYAYVHVKYSYKVGTTEYVGERVYPEGKIEYTLKKAQGIVDQLPSPLPVHYDPDDPQFAYVLTNPSWTYLIPLAIGGICLLVGIVRILGKLGGKTA